MDKKNLFWQNVADKQPWCRFEQELNCQFVDFDAELAALTLQFDVDERFTNPVGGLHGGIISALLDNSCGAVVAAHLNSGQFAPTLELKTSFIAAAQPGRFTTRTKLLKRTAHIAFTESQLFDEKGKLIATASSTLYIKTLSH